MARKLDESGDDFMAWGGLLTTTLQRIPGPDLQPPPQAQRNQHLDAATAGQVHFSRWVSAALATFNNALRDDESVVV